MQISGNGHQCGSGVDASKHHQNTPATLVQTSASSFGDADRGYTLPAQLGKRDQCQSDVPNHQVSLPILEAHRQYYTVSAKVVRAFLAFFGEH